MSHEERNDAIRSIRGILEAVPDNGNSNGFSPGVVRNLSQGRHSSTSSSSTYVSKSPQSSCPPSNAQTGRSGRAPAEIYYEQIRLKSSRSPRPPPIVEDRTSTNDGEQLLDHETEPMIPVLGTDHRLQNFEAVIERAYSNHPELIQQQQDRRREIRERQKLALMPRRTLKALRRRLEVEKGRDAPTAYFKPFFRTMFRALFRKEARVPKDEDLIKLAHHFYPPIGKMTVHVFDFGPNYCRHTTTTLGDIENAFNSKPREAKVRWIHASLGVGITHSSVEELFKKAGPGPGKQLNRARGISWTPLYDTVLEFHHKDYFKEKRDTFLLLRKRRGLSKLLDDSLFLDVKNDKLKKDMEWRYHHFNTKMTFWNIMKHELPDQLSESIIAGEIQWPADGLTSVDQTIPAQMFSRHPFYKQAGARLIKTRFSTFHREDGQSLLSVYKGMLTGNTGYLLTISPMNGVNYVDNDFAEKVKEPPQCRIFDESTSALARVWQVFEKTGTSTWPSETVEWFTVYLLTEVCATSNTISQGFNAPTLLRAYESMALDLVSILDQPSRKELERRRTRKRKKGVGERACRLCQSLTWVFSAETEAAREIPKEVVRGTREGLHCMY